MALNPSQKAEWDLWDAVGDKICALIDEESATWAREDHESGMDASGIQFAILALNKPIPRSLVDAIMSFEEALNEWNGDWYGVIDSLKGSISDLGVDETQ